MFYSQCLISRTGPLKPIWIAAYCQKKLKKEQITETNISSSVDEIMLHEVTVTYRVLGYLLLGVVRIYSKKVEYLYHDCNDVLTKMNTCVPCKKKPKEGMCAPYCSITLPERFELDDFDLELPEDMGGGNIATNQQITLEEKLEHAGYEQYSWDKYYQEDYARFEINDCVHTPVRDALSPHSRDNYMEVCPSDILISLEARMEKFQGHQLPREEFSDIGTSYGAEEPVELGMQLNEVGSKAKRIHFLEVTPPDPGKSVVLNEGELLDTTEDNPTYDAGLSNEPQAKRIKLIEITPPDPRKCGVISDGDPLANTADIPPHDSSTPKDTGAATPELMVIRTPAKQEPLRFSRKRKHAFDDIIVLSNEVMKQSLSDSSHLAVKRRNVPLTALDVWKAHKVKDFYQDFLEPLITGTTQLKTLFYKRNVANSLPFETTEGLNKSGQDRCETYREPSEERACSYEASEGPTRLEDRYETHREPSEERAHSPEAAEAPITSAEDIYETHGEPSETRDNSEKITMDDPTRSSVETPTTSKSDMGLPMTSFSTRDDDLSDIEAQDIGLNLTDEELRPSEDDNNENYDGWSVRTRKVASFLCKSFLKRKERGNLEVLNLKPVLQGRTKKESARLFYEILVLKSLGFVDMKQDAPYGDICLKSAPKLVATV